MSTEGKITLLALDLLRIAICCIQLKYKRLVGLLPYISFVHLLIVLSEDIDYGDCEY